MKNNESSPDLLVATREKPSILPSVLEAIELESDKFEVSELLKTMKAAPTEPKHAVQPIHKEGGNVTPKADIQESSPSFFTGKPLTELNQIQTEVLATIARLEGDIVKQRAVVADDMEKSDGPINKRYGAAHRAELAQTALDLKAQRAILVLLEQALAGNTPSEEYIDSEPEVDETLQLQKSVDQSAFPEIAYTQEGEAPEERDILFATREQQSILPDILETTSHHIDTSETQTELSEVAKPRESIIQEKSQKPKQEVAVAQTEEELAESLRILMETSMSDREVEILQKATRRIINEIQERFDNIRSKNEADLKKSQRQAEDKGLILNLLRKSGMGKKMVHQLSGTITENIAREKKFHELSARVQEKIALATRNRATLALMRLGAQWKWNDQNNQAPVIGKWVDKTGRQVEKGTPNALFVPPKGALLIVPEDIQETLQAAEPPAVTEDEVESLLQRMVNAPAGTPLAELIQILGPLWHSLCGCVAAPATQLEEQYNTGWFLEYLRTGELPGNGC
jgi:hypothetical protein